MSETIERASESESRRAFPIQCGRCGACKNWVREASVNSAWVTHVHVEQPTRFDLTILGADLSTGGLDEGVWTAQAEREPEARLIGD